MSAQRKNGCRGDNYCVGLQSIMPHKSTKPIACVSLVMDIETGREFNVVVFDGPMSKKSAPRPPMPNWCPFCRGRLNKAYYDHCQRRSA